MNREEFERLKEEKFIKSAVVSDSMEPIINTDEMILIQTGINDLKRFDIIVIYFNGKLLCHYIWRINKILEPILLQTRSMKGESDIPVPLGDCLGKVTSHRLNLLKKLRLLIF